MPMIPNWSRIDTHELFRSALPVVVCFASATCAASAAMLDLLDQISPEFADRVQFVHAPIEEHALFAQQYFVDAVPTLLALEAGEPITRMIGFAPHGLLRLFCAEIADGSKEPRWQWSPVEDVFEDEVILPLLHTWGVTTARQVACSVQTGQRRKRGRIDVLVSTADQVPLTLFENKRLITNARDLQQAVTQAHGYARSLALPSFVVAAPSGMWVYRLDDDTPTCVAHFSSLALWQQPDNLRTLVLDLRDQWIDPAVDHTAMRAV